MINLVGFQNINKLHNLTQNNSAKGFRYASLSQKADTFERTNATTCPINFTGKSNRLKEYKKITENLNQTGNDAQTSLNKQLATEGWSGKTADAISIIWNSKNRAALVQADIDKYKNQVQELDNSIKEDKFKDKFKEIFDVEYDHSNIIRYGKKSKQLETALITDCIAKYTEEKLSKNIEIYNKNSGNLQDITEKRANPYATTGSVPYYNHTTPKDKVFENMENSLVEVLGDKKVLDTILSANGINSEKASKEEKYKVYGYLSNFIVESSKATAQKNLKGESLSQIQKECDKNYEKAFGTKNDIVKRVDKYNSSQKIGSACVKFVTNVVLNTLGPSSVLASCIYSAGKSVAMDIADAKTKDVDRELNLKSVALNAGLNGAGGIANRIIVNKYAGGVAAKILAGKTASNSITSMLTDFVVKEIISKEGVKLPAYAVEEIVSSVANKMAGIKTEDGNLTLTQKGLIASMGLVSEAMTSLAVAKEDNKLKNPSQKEMLTFLNKHIEKSAEDDEEVKTWLNKNNKAFQKVLNQLVENELPKLKGELKVKK